MLTLEQMLPILFSSLEKFIPGISQNSGLQDAAKNLMPQVLQLLNKKPAAQETLNQLADKADDKGLQEQLMGHIQSIVTENPDMIKPFIEKAGLEGVLGLAKGLF